MKRVLVFLLALALLCVSVSALAATVCRCWYS